VTWVPLRKKFVPPISVDDIVGAGVPQSLRRQGLATEIITVIGRTTNFIGIAQAESQRCMFVIVVIGLRELRESGDRRLAEKIGLDAVENIRRVKTRSGRVLLQQRHGVGTELHAIKGFDVLVQVIAADRPVEFLSGRRGQAEFLGKLVHVDIVAGNIVVDRLDAEIAAGIVGVEVEMADSGDGGERQISDIPVQLVGAAGGVGRDRPDVGIGVGPGVIIDVSAQGRKQVFQNRERIVVGVTRAGRSDVFDGARLALKLVTQPSL